MAEIESDKPVTKSLLGVQTPDGLQTVLPTSSLAARMLADTDFMEQTLEGIKAVKEGKFRSLDSIIADLDAQQRQ